MRRFLLLGALLAATGLVHAADGKTVYETNCQSCHQADGAGAVGLAPPLAGTLGGRLASDAGRRYVSGVILGGLAGKLESKGVVYNGIMPSWQALPDAELAAVANYVVSTFNAVETPAGHREFAADEFAAKRAAKPTAKELRALRSESEPAAK
jgi:mono/diheme cytochrome c family protein